MAAISNGGGLEITMKSILFVPLFLLLLATTALAQANPVPFVNQPLVPTSAAPGGAGFTLTVNGGGFVTNSVVTWNGRALATHFVNGTQLTAAVPASEIAAAGTASVMIASPAPGGGISDVNFFPIRKPFGAVSFDQAPFDTGVGPVGFVVGDLNGDGRLDLVSLNYDPSKDSSSVSILLGNGDGSLQPHVDYPLLPEYGTEAVAADFNGDGKLDLGICNVLGFISIMLGNGDGTFQQHKDFATPTLAVGLTASDFNGDGKVDVAVALYGIDAKVAILLGNGDGTLQKATDLYSTGSGSAYDISEGDLNQDGRIDLAVTVGDDASVAILLGNGDGTFNQGVLYRTSYYPQTVMVADLNHDGFLDLAVTTSLEAASSPISVLLGNGDGTFLPHADYPLPTRYSTGIAIGDLDGDGNLDLVASSFDRSVVTFLGKGDGTFQIPGNFPSGQDSLAGVAIGDFDGDGMIDIATASYYGDKVVVMKQATAVLSRTQLNFGQIKVGSIATKKVPQ
jgi:hypothetical protein